MPRSPHRAPVASRTPTQSHPLSTSDRSEDESGLSSAAATVATATTARAAAAMTAATAATVCRHTRRIKVSICRARECTGVALCGRQVTHAHLFDRIRPSKTGPKAGPKGSRTPLTSDKFGSQDTGLGPVGEGFLLLWSICREARCCRDNRRSLLDHWNAQLSLETADQSRLHHWHH